MNKISVIIPAHDYGHFLEECIRSVLNQTKKPDEIIVVNDSSLDNTQDIITNLQENSKVPIKYYEVAFKHSNKTRNFGYKESIGDHVLFLDADNYLEPRYLELTSKALDEEGISFVYTNWYWVDIDSERVGQPAASVPFSYDELKGRNYIDMCTLIKRETFDKYMFDEEQNGYDDWDLWLTFAENGHIGKHLPLVLFNYRRHNNSKSYKIVHFNREEIVNRIHSKHNL